jgi:hypothetical protein
MPVAPSSRAHDCRWTSAGWPAVATSVAATMLDEPEKIIHLRQPRLALTQGGRRPRPLCIGRRIIFQPSSTDRLPIPILRKTSRNLAVPPTSSHAAITVSHTFVSHCSLRYISLHITGATRRLLVLEVRRADPVVGRTTRGSLAGVRRWRIVGGGRHSCRCCRSNW